jgi:hypothetical protein
VNATSLGFCPAMSHIVICHVLMLCRGSGSPADAAGQPACHRLGSGHLPLMPSQPVQLPQQATHTAHAASKYLRAQGRGLSHHRLGAAQQPAQHAHAIAEEATVGRMMKRGLHHRAIHAELPPAGYLQRARQLDDSLVERRQRGGSIRLAQRSRVVSSGTGAPASVEPSPPGLPCGLPAHRGSPGPQPAVHPSGLVKRGLGRS